MKRSKPLVWVPVGPGQMALTHRPQKHGVLRFREEGATAILTLLSEKERGAQVGKAAEAAHLRWLWLPLENATPPGPHREAEILARLLEVRDLLAAGERVILHCSAGIHRTGMMAYALLRLSGVSPEEARTLLAKARAATASGVGERRLAWGDRLAAGGARSESGGIEAVHAQ